jgi:ABC-type phosphate transport system permease subunit
MVLPMNKRTKRKKNRFSKFLVTMVILLNILFTVAVLYVFLQTGSEPVTLIGCWFAFTTGELWMLSSIKKTKVRKDGNDINENN